MLTRFAAIIVILSKFIWKISDLKQFLTLFGKCRNALLAPFLSIFLVRLPISVETHDTQYQFNYRMCGKTGWKALAPKYFGLGGMREE